MVSGHLRVRESLGLLIEESVRKHIGGHQRVALPEGTPLVQLTGALPRRYHRRGIFFSKRPLQDRKDCTLVTTADRLRRANGCAQSRPEAPHLRRLLTERVGLIGCSHGERSGRFEQYEERG